MPSTRNREIRTSAELGESAQEATARVMLTPEVQAATVLLEGISVEPKPDLAALAKELSRQSKALREGDLSRAENMLTTQAHTLDVIFNRLANRALMNVGEYMDATETYLKLALKAQAQSRATWEALSAIQNPPVAGYIKQANIAHGHQQVNNGPRTRETEKPPTQLLEKTDGNRLDFGAPSTAGTVDTPVATLGEVDRSEDGSG